ncbi:hypothetical protein PMW03_11300, partial [Clostridium paraputrificum]
MDIFLQLIEDEKIKKCALACITELIKAFPTDNLKEFGEIESYNKVNIGKEYNTDNKCAMAVYSYNYKRILFKYNKSDKLTHDFNKAIFHEYGHLLDFTLINDDNSYLSDLEEIQVAYNDFINNNDKNKIGSEITISNIREFFAEMFSLFFLVDRLIKKEYMKYIYPVIDI